MYPILFSIGRYNFYTHGFVAVAGMIIGTIVSYYLARKKGLDYQYFFDNIVFTILFGIVGARIAYILIYPDQFTGIIDALYIWQGGLVSYGGFVLGGIAFAILVKKQGQVIQDWLDILIPGFFLGLSIGRIGDYLSGEYNGAASSIKPFLADHSNIVPVSLYEAVLCFVIFVLSLVLFIKFMNVLRRGVLVWGSILLYSVGRFILDFYRVENDLFWKLSPGQLFGLLLFLISLIALIIAMRRERSEYDIAR